MNYNSRKLKVRLAPEFSSWFAKLDDRIAAKKVGQRIARIELGNLGDAKYFRGIGELRVDGGPGYRIYFVRREKVVVVLLLGGDKSTQNRDIERAVVIAERF